MGVPVNEESLRGITTQRNMAKGGEDETLDRNRRIRRVCRDCLWRELVAGKVGHCQYRVRTVRPRRSVLRRAGIYAARYTP